MEINDNLIEVLNDLIQINNDRIEGYKKAAAEANDRDVDLKSIFYKMADESRQYVAELTQEVVKLGGEPDKGTTVSGKIYRAWMDVKATFTGRDRHDLLASCEFGEDAAQKAYQEALISDDTLSIDIRQLIANQKASLKISHDTIKKYRDMYKQADSDNLADIDNLKSSKVNAYGNRDDSDLTGARMSSGAGNATGLEDLSDSNNENRSGNTAGSGTIRNNL